MHRTTGAGNVGGQFVDEVPGVSPGTSIEQDWLNTMQEELVAIVTGAGDALNPADDGQVLAAITKLIASLSSSAHSVAGADYVILDNDGFTDIDVVAGVADRTITLPASATNAGRRLRVRKSDAGVGKVIVAAAGADTINGTPTWEITEQYGFVALRLGGSLWNVEAQEGSVYKATDTTQRTQASPVAGIWYNLGAFSLAIPEGGIYEIKYEAVMKSEDANGQWVGGYATLSQANNSEDDRELSAVAFSYVANSIQGAFYAPVGRTKRLSVVGGTVFYLNLKTYSDAASSLGTRSDLATAVISARRIS